MIRKTGKMSVGFRLLRATDLNGLALLLGLGMAVGGIAVSGCSAISWQVRAGAAAMGLAGTGVVVAAPTVFYHGRNRDGSPVHCADSQKTQPGSVTSMAREDLMRDVCRQRLVTCPLNATTFQCVYRSPQLPSCSDAHFDTFTQFPSTLAEHWSPLTGTRQTPADFFISTPSRVASDAGPNS